MKCLKDLHNSSFNSENMLKWIHMFRGGLLGIKYSRCFILDSILRKTLSVILLLVHLVPAVNVVPAARTFDSAASDK